MNPPGPEPADHVAVDAAAPREEAVPGEISSQQLLGGKAEVFIRHGDDLYRLRLTRNGKLILQK